METVAVQLETSNVTLEVTLAAAGLPGAAGPGLPVSGAEYALPEKGAGGDFDVRWTHKPKVHSLTVDPANPAASPLAVGEITWDATSKTPKQRIGADGVEAVFFIDLFRNPVKNAAGRIVQRGEVLVLTGVDLSGNYSGTPMAANNLSQGYMVLGLAAETLAIDAVGLVKYGGLIKDINTTGAAVSETWGAGDLLYVHPTVPGALTRIRPAAPAQVLPIAAVLVTHATLGIIGVQTGMREDVAYGGFSHLATQSLVSANTPTTAIFGVTDLSKGVSIASNSRITFARAGSYRLDLKLQVDKTSANAANVYAWLAKNGITVANSASSATVSGNSQPTQFALAHVVEVAVNDYIELLWGSDSVDTHLDFSAASWYPAIPSVRALVTQIPT